MVRDFLTVWVLPVAILLPPVYAMVMPVPLLMLTQWHMHWGMIYRRVFTGAAIGLAYGVASIAFHAIPASFAGPSDRHRRARADLDRLGPHGRGHRLAGTPRPAGDRGQDV